MLALGHGGLVGLRVGSRRASQGGTRRSTLGRRGWHAFGFFFDGTQALCSLFLALGIVQFDLLVAQACLRIAHLCTHTAQAVFYRKPLITRGLVLLTLGSDRRALAVNALVLGFAMGGGRRFGGIVDNFRRLGPGG
ncbi:hypothetical protein D3C71_1715450 [compost metagenome]